MFKAPWLDFYGDVPKHLDYPDLTMYEYLNTVAERYPDYIAYEFMDSTMTFSGMMEEIRTCARSLRAIGIQEDDRVTLCLPNVPQAVILFYAVNAIGAISNMIHPLSSEGEIEFFIKESNSVAAFTMDLFYEKFDVARQQAPFRHLITTSVKDKLNLVKRIGYSLTKGRSVKPIPKDADVLDWKSFLDSGKSYVQPFEAKRRAEDPAVILYSGGTSGTTKGVLLSNLNFNALAMQTSAMGECVFPGHSILSILPMFHGFGLGIGIHTMLSSGCKCILIPAFNAQTFGKLIMKKKPNYIAGVPTLYEALLRNDKLKGVNLEFLEGVFAGGDSLSIELKKKMDNFLKEHGAPVQIREGYGLTESVTASCLTPMRIMKEGSIGLPFPDTFYKIVKPNTQEEVPYGEIGEICINGPTVMLGYLGNPKETAHTLQLHPDGATWLHTGDLGMMDEEGFIYFRQRLKRMIISSGYSIYPSQLENIIDGHEAVLMSTVIGVDDPYKIQKIKAFVVLKPDVKPTDEIKDSIRKHCEKNIAKYAMPYEFEYRESLPKTLVGKVAYTILEAEEREKNQATSEQKN